MNYFFHNSIRKYIVGFGSLFNDIHVQRPDPYGGAVQDIRVPLRYGGKSKYYIDLKQNLDSIKRPYQIMLPAMYFVMTDLSYDAARMNAPVANYKHITENDNIKSMFTPVPFNIQIAMGIWTSNIIDSHQIIEQIIPMFRPYYNIQIKELTEMGIENVSVPIEMSNCSLDLESEMNEDAGSLRTIQWNLGFVIKGRLYPAIKDSAIIKKVYMDLGIQLDDPYSDGIVTYSQEDFVDPLVYGYDQEWRVKETRTEDNKSSTYYFSKDTV